GPGGRRPQKAWNHFVGAVLVATKSQSERGESSGIVATVEKPLEGGRCLVGRISRKVTQLLGSELGERRGRNGRLLAFQLFPVGLRLALWCVTRRDPDDREQEERAPHRINPSQRLS